jgi:hypothetical protein
VALKVIRPALAGSSAARQRFLAEARATAAIEHDHIVTIHQVGEDRGVLFLAMPLLKGETLEARLKREGKLAVGEVLRIGREITEGLAAAHESKLIHRDIKPSNIWLEGKSGRVKILDFGLARAMDDPGHLTRSGSVAGTPQYMAPEQAAGSRVDARCDLFSLGCVLYRLATGTLPFQGANTMQLLRALDRDQPRPPHEIHPEVPVALSELIMQLLAKDREERPPHARSVVETLEHLAAIPQASATLLPHAQAESRGQQPLDQEIGRERTRSEFLAAVAVDSTPTAVRIETPPVRARRRARRWLLVATILAPVLAGLTGLGGILHALRMTYDGGQVAQESVPAPVPEPALVGPPGEIGCFKGHTGAVGPVACSADGRLALSGSWDGTMRLWDLATGKQLQCFKGHTGWVWSVAFSADSRRALSVGTFDKAARLWDVARGKELGSQCKPGERFLGAAFLPDGPYALMDTANALRLWHVERGQEVQRFMGHTDRVWRVALSPDGRRLLSGGYDKTARLWDVATGRELQRFEGHTAVPEGHTGAVHAVALSPDSRRVLTGCQDGILRLWDADTGQLLRRLKGHRGSVESVAFAPDGRRALSGGWDKVLRLWEVDSGQALCHLEGHTELIGGVTFTPDGGRAVTGGADGTVRLWRLPP